MIPPGQQTKDKIINRFAVKMANSNHSRTQIHKVITAGLTGYERMLARQLKGGKTIHTPSSLAQRHRKKNSSAKRDGSAPTEGRRMEENKDWATVSLEVEKRDPDPGNREDLLMPLPWRPELCCLWSKPRMGC